MLQTEQETPPDRVRMLTRHIVATDRQIDRLVYELHDPSDRCDLTEEEIGIVEDGTRR